MSWSLDDSPVDTHGVTTWEPRTLGDRLSVSAYETLADRW
jgi:hypothetical protein